MKKYIAAILLVVPLFTFAHVDGTMHQEITADTGLLQQIQQQLNTSVTTQSTGSGFTGALRVRQKELIELAKQSPATALRFVVPASTRSKQSVEAQKYIEQAGSLSGTLEVIHVDDFDNPENSYFMYAVNNGGVKTNVYTVKEISSRSGTKVSLQGYKLNATEFLTDGKNVSLGAMPDVGAVGKQRLLVILVNSVSEPGQPVTTSQVEDYINNGQFQKFIKEASYGQTWFEAKAYGWLTLTDPNVRLLCGMPDKSNSEVQAFLRKNSISLTNFDRLLFLSTGAAACSEVGKSNVSQAWISLHEDSMKEYGHSFPWTYFDALLAHELGHSLGLWHANGFDCGEKALSGTCTHVEYGNDYDVMGGHAKWSLQYNGFYKEILGWIKPNEILNINTSGKYNIGHLESNTASKKFAKITNPSLIDKGAVYFLESRASVGFDADIPKPTGLLVTRPVISRGGAVSSQLIDTIPSNKSWFEDIKDAAIVAGGNFTDSGTGISINQVSVVSATATTTSFAVTIGQPSCVRNGLRFVDETKGTNVSRNSSQARSLQLVNNDSVGCGASKFDIEAVLPAGWEVIESSKSLPFSPGEENYGILRYDIPGTAALGEQIISIYSINKTTGARVLAGSMVVEVFEHVSVSSITPQPAKRGDKVTLVVRNHDQYVKKVNLVKSDDNMYISAEIPAQVTQDSITFVIPQEVCIERKGGDCDYELLPNGEYKLRIYGYSVLENVPILIGEKVQPPTTATSTITSIKHPVPAVAYRYQNYPIIWEGTNLSKVNIDLYDGDKGTNKMATIEENYAVPFSKDNQTFTYNWDVDLNRLPEGEYTIRITDALNKKTTKVSPPLKIQTYQAPVVGTAQSVATSSLRLITLPIGDKKSAVAANFTVKINATVGDVYVSRKSFYVGIARLTPKDAPYEYSSQWRIANISSVTGDYIVGDVTSDQAYKILKGKSATFSVLAEFNPDQMFAGQYQAQLYDVAVLNTQQQKGRLTLAPFVTNPLTIVGEKSPFITSVSNPTKANLPVIIEGVRFSTKENVLLANGKQYNLKGAVNNKITFIPSEIGLPVGTYGFQIDSPYGKSNYESLDIKEPTNAANVFTGFWQLITGWFKSKPVPEATPTIEKVTSIDADVPKITVISPNGGETIPFTEITMAGDLGFKWKSEISPTSSFYAAIINENGVLVRDTNRNSLSSLGGGLYVSSFIGESKIEINKKYKIKVCDTISGYEVCDTSDGYFIIE